MPYYTMMVDRVRRLTQAFDIVHFHIDMFHFPLFRGLENRTLTTLHGRQDLPDLFPFYQAFPKMPLVSISDSQRTPDRGCEFRRHGAARAAGRSARADFRAARAAISPSSVGSRPRKRPDRAIKLARVDGDSAEDRGQGRQGRREIFPRGHQAAARQRAAASSSSAKSTSAARRSSSATPVRLLFPIDWPEPFGLVMIEAMACGTPVLAFRNGSVPEVIDDGVTGRIVDTMEEALAALPEVIALDRRAVRAPLRGSGSAPPAWRATTSRSTRSSSVIAGRAVLAVAGAAWTRTADSTPSFR